MEGAIPPLHKCRGILARFRMNILLGVTGSVAAILTPKLYAELSKIGNVRIVATEKGMFFIRKACSEEAYVTTVYTDSSEWNWEEKGDPVQHIDLAEWADVLVIAPLTANTLAKMAHGICDNLLTCIWMAWDRYKYVIIAPAMNTKMWENNITRKNLHSLPCFDLGRKGIHVPPVKKQLACGTVGIGAMASIEDILKEVRFVARRVEEVKK